MSIHQTEDSDFEFLQLVRQRERGKLKLYIGSAAGVGKTFRMLNEARELRARGVDAVLAFIETHGRLETEAQIGDLETIGRSKIQYRGVLIDEMDLDAVLARRPTVAVVDELAHTNIPGTQHEKRWQDVVALLDAGINVISAVNVQHLESLNDVVAATLGVTVRETVPDWVIAGADQVVNLDMSAQDLRGRLRDGKIYREDKIESALRNFFTEENLTTLRELALREVASSVDRHREQIVRREAEHPAAPEANRSDRVMVAMASNPPFTAMLLRKASRIAGRLNSDWYCVYVQTPRERADRIDTAVQRTLVSNIQRAQSMGAKVVKLEGDDVAEALFQFATRERVSLLIVGESRKSRILRWFAKSVVDKLVAMPRTFDILVAAYPLERANSRSSFAPSQQTFDEPNATSMNLAATAMHTVAPPVSGIREAQPVAAAPPETPTLQLKAETVSEYARLCAAVAASALARIDEVRLPLHILLENRFGDLNENQEEMIATASTAAEIARDEWVEFQQFANQRTVATPHGRTGFQSDNI